MNAPVIALPDFDALRQFVRAALCDHDRLDAGQAAFRQARICRGERTCGLFFQVEGMHRQRAFAVWASDEHRLLFYDAAGTRYHEIQLSESPDPEMLDRRAA